MSSASQRMPRQPVGAVDPIATLNLAIGFAPAAGGPLMAGPLEGLRNDLQAISDVLSRMSVRESGRDPDETVHLLADVDAGLQRIASSLEDETVETTAFHKMFARRSDEIDGAQARTEALLRKLVSAES